MKTQIFSLKRQSRGYNYISHYTCARVRMLTLVALSAVAGFGVAGPLTAAGVESRVLDGVATDAVRPGEESFLRKAADIARLQLTIAELGATQSTRAELRSHAEQLKSDNRQLIDALAAVMDRKGVGHASPPSPVGRGYAGLAEKAGAEFDREFVRLLAQLHEQALTLFEQARSEAKDLDVRDLAGSQLPMLRAHRNRIVELRRDFE